MDLFQLYDKRFYYIFSITHLVNCCEGFFPLVYIIHPGHRRNLFGSIWHVSINLRTFCLTHPRSYTSCIIMDLTSLQTVITPCLWEPLWVNICGNHFPDGKWYNIVPVLDADYLVQCYSILKYIISLLILLLNSRAHLNNNLLLAMASLLLWVLQLGKVVMHAQLVQPPSFANDMFDDSRYTIDWYFFA